MLASGGFFGMSLYAWLVFILFGIGAIVMRAAGCVINDLWDRDLDKKVERTKERPLAAGTVNAKQAMSFLAGLLTAGLLILLSMNRLTVILGIMTIPLIIAYPLMKRLTWWPQAFLGITFNFGALMGYSAISGSIGISSLLLYLGGICWTLGYDTVYAHQDKEDDALAGIKSTALLFGSESGKWVKRFYELTTLLLVFAVLLTSGLFAALAVSARGRGERRTARLHLGAAGLLGLVFLAVKIVEYADKLEAGIGMETNTFFTLYYLLTGFHFLHVIFGLIVLAIVAVWDSMENTETGAAFWHMVDLVWVLIFPVIYLVR